MIAYENRYEYSRIFQNGKIAGFCMIGSWYATIKKRSLSQAPKGRGNSFDQKQQTNMHVSDFTGCNNNHSSLPYQNSTREAISIISQISFKIVS